MRGTGSDGRVLVGVWIGKSGKIAITPEARRAGAAECSFSFPSRLPNNPVIKIICGISMSFSDSEQP